MRVKPMPEDYTHLALFLSLLFAGLWKPIGWLRVICGISVLSIAVPIVMEAEEYGLPFIFIGLGLFVLGVFNFDRTGGKD